MVSVDQEDRVVGQEDQGRVEDRQEDLLEVLEEQTASDEVQECQDLEEVGEQEQEPRKKAEAGGFLELRKLLSGKLTGQDMTGC